MRYIQGADLPDLQLTWQDSTGNVIDFSTGWTFQVKVGKTGQPATFTKTAGIAGTATAPNVTVVWADGELDSLSPGAFRVLVTATRNADSKVRKIQTDLTVERSTT